LGDQKRTPQYSCSYIISLLRGNKIKDIARLICGKIKESVISKKRCKDCDNKNYASTYFMPFYYKKGNYLPFKDGSFNYIFSEHFLEHLFLDEALSLFRECYRVTRWNGVVRTCVPDADLRPTPEPVGHPARQMPYTHPDKHKTRWSVYSLSEILRLAGFEPVPVRYYDKMSQYHELSPPDLKEIYQSCADPEIALDFRHIQRKDSLIVDGIKRRT
jgi:predicted SAM-dependent methyltransferase